MPEAISNPTMNAPSPKGLVKDDVMRVVASFQVPQSCVEKPASVEEISTRESSSVISLAMISPNPPLKPLRRSQ